MDEGLVVYEHTQIEALGWNGEDSFTFTVSSPPATLDLQVFHIAISYDINRHDHNSHLLANTGKVTVAVELLYFMISYGSNKQNKKTEKLIIYDAQLCN